LAQDQYTGTGAMAQTWTPGIKCRLIEIELHLSAAGGTSEYFTATKDDHTNPVYDVVYVKEDMVSLTDFVDTDKHEIETGDAVVFAYTNTNARTWGLTVKYERINEALT
jgi:hypothetical protein